MRDPASLVEHPRNYNTHPAEQIRLLAKIIKHQGWRNPITVSKRSGYVVKGHGRLAAALQLGCSEVPVDVQEYKDEASEYADMIADNRIAELAEADQDALKELLTDDVFEGFDLDLTGFGDLDFLNDEIDNTDLNDDSENAEDLIDQGDILQQKWGTKLGQIWQLGDHRLMCGDSTLLKSVETLMGGKKCDMLLSDPPYGVSYVGKTKDSLKIENDDLDESKLSDLVELCFSAAESVSRKGAYWYATVPAGPLHFIFGLDWKKRGILRQILVWNKDSMVLGRSEYHYKHEPILFGWVPGGNRHENNDRTRTSVWDCARPKVNKEHPTMKPVELWARALHDGSRQGDIVYDPFCGSGTSVLACEQLSRKCYAMELSPKYAAVILQRWHDMTNQDPVLIETIDS
jgi:site-specific DNA-methyltransferase (adenine-specific)